MPLLKVMKQHSVYYNQKIQWSDLRPSTPESAGSRPISEAKLVMAWSVLWSGTTWEYHVLQVSFFGHGVKSCVCIYFTMYQTHGLLNE